MLIKGWIQEEDVDEWVWDEMEIEIVSTKNGPANHFYISSHIHATNFLKHMMEGDSDLTPKSKRAIREALSALHSVPNNDSHVVVTDVKVATVLA